ncbi:MAG: cyclic pyranopterin monophosphate synthase MoaC [Planctomycetota bacterium]|nr:cyclic pyranopterin monophosphate synthase MoaC [Planctomycetota bacterium]
MDSKLTHLDEAGRAHMVDVSAKQSTVRRAVAEGRVAMRPATVALITSGTVAKGDALAVARVAGIQGAKRAADLIPLCHPIRLDKVSIDLAPEDEAVRITADVVAFDRTGVEMEAMAAVAAAGLALYDMIKGVDRSARLEGVQLLRKEGGRSGLWLRAETTESD